MFVGVGIYEGACLSECVGMGERQRQRERERERERERAYMCDEKTVPTRVAENITSYFP